MDPLTLNAVMGLLKGGQGAVAPAAAVSNSGPSWLSPGVIIVIVLVIGVILFWNTIAGKQGLFKKNEKNVAERQLTARVRSDNRTTRSVNRVDERHITARIRVCSRPKRRNSYICKKYADTLMIQARKDAA